MYKSSPRALKRAMIQVLKRTTSTVLDGTNFCGVFTEDVGQGLGEKEDIDQCCYTHKKCGPSIRAGHTVDGLTNDDENTRKHCDCDEEFCLKAVGTDDATYAWESYFVTYKDDTKCFRESYPQICTETGPNGKCTKWEDDLNQPVENHWSEPNLE